MKSIVLIVLFSFSAATFTSCSTVEGSSMEEERALLKEKYSEILDLSDSKACNDPENWSFTPIGSKACGGPTGFIAYSEKIDVEAFLERVRSYTRAEALFNEKWGATSDCALAPEPVRVVCENNEAVLVYD